MTDIVKSAIAERAKLEVELSQNPIFQKIKMLEAIINNFGNKSIAVSSKGTKKDQIHELAIECIKENGGSAKLAVIVDYVNSHGMPVKLGMVKSYLYKFTDLKTSREKGFALKR